MKLIPLFLFVAGCSSLRIETGHTNPVFGGRDWGKGNWETLPITAYHGSVHFEQELLHTEYVVIEAGVGPSYVYSHSGWLLGGEAVLRVKSTEILGRCKPFVFVTSGMYFSEGWRRGNDVNYTFSNGIGVGVEYEVSETLSLSTDIRWFHISNGESFYGDDFRNVLGLAKADNNRGFQNIGVFVGFIWRFDQ